MRNVLGVLPLAGSGLRLGVKFHKALTPIILGNKLVPIVDFSIQRLSKISDRTLGILAPGNSSCFKVEDYKLDYIYKSEIGELPSSIQVAAQYAVNNQYEFIAVCLPDTIWYPENGFNLLYDSLESYDGVLGLFYGDSRVLDEVKFNTNNIAKFITLHGNTYDKRRNVWGWGCLILKSKIALLLNDESPLASQLSSFNLKVVKLGKEFYDSGTPERYKALFLRMSKK